MNGTTKISCHDNHDEIKVLFIQVLLCITGGDNKIVLMFCTLLLFCWVWVWSTECLADIHDFDQSAQPQSLESCAKVSAAMWYTIVFFSGCSSIISTKMQFCSHFIMYNQIKNFRRLHQLQPSLWQQLIVCFTCSVPVASCKACYIPHIFSRKPSMLVAKRNGSCNPNC